MMDIGNEDAYTYNTNVHSYFIQKSIHYWLLYHWVKNSLQQKVSQ